jgi:nucleoid DNA-binding protein
MDISSYIQDLLWDYECVIIPGFGGILASYRPAEMVLAEHTLYPPSKALAFNEYLTKNDGLLINYICQKDNIDYSKATEEVDAWVQKTKKLLANNEEIYLPAIGRFQRDVERNLQFTADTKANYLYSAYGLRKVVASPVLRDKSDANIEVIEAHRASYALPRTNKTWAMAAMVLLFLTIGTVSSLMYQGVNIKPLNLNTASVLSFMEKIEKPVEAIPQPKVSINTEIPELVANNDVQSQPVVISTSTTVDSTTDHSSPPVRVQLETTNTGVSSTTGRKYYVIIGSFHEPKNLHHAEDYLRERHPSEQPFEDTTPDWVRIGFYAGDTYAEAFKKLQEARRDDQKSWLLVRQ